MDPWLELFVFGPSDDDSTELESNDEESRDALPNSLNEGSVVPGQEDQSHPSVSSQPDASLTQSASASPAHASPKEYSRSKALTKRSDHHPMLMKFSELKEIEPTTARKLVKYYNKFKRRSNVLLCGLFLAGKCAHMTLDLRHMLSHMKNQHPKKKDLRAIRVFGCPVLEQQEKIDCRTPNYYDYNQLTFEELKKANPELALQVLNFYREKGKKLCNIHLCGLCMTGDCNFMSLFGPRVLIHVDLGHPQRSDILVYKITDLRFAQ